MRTNLAVTALLIVIGYLVYRNHGDWNFLHMAAFGGVAYLGLRA